MSGHMPALRILAFALAAAFASACLRAAGPIVRPPKPVNSPEVSLGERLFLETRFAQYFSRRSLGDANAVLASGDASVAVTAGVVSDLPGAFAGKSMNCRACHLVDEFAESAGTRTYCDFARRSPIPSRDDGLVTTPRNSPGLVGLFSGAGAKAPLHFDGEFSTPEDLVIASYTGRNFGWLPGEYERAVAHIAKIIREDDGSALLARRFGGSYATVFAGVDSVIPPKFRIPAEYRLDVSKATNEEILHRVAKLVTAYMRSLDFAKDADGSNTGSAYDRFLKINGLPRSPEKGESPLDYSRRLIALIRKTEAPVYVSASDGKLFTHKHDFVFGPKELAGLGIFFAEPDKTASAPKTSGVGNCIACHTPPDFTDFRIHNTGESQATYDDIHGDGAFAALRVPTLAGRQANPGDLPPTPEHPSATSRFASPASSFKPGATDLGVWNVFANPDFPKAQPALTALLRAPGETAVPEDTLLSRSLARFKTPTVRDLGHSAPYLHDGEKDSVENVIRFYREISSKARAGLVRNAAPELSDIRLAPADETALAAFLRSLDEDYE